ncbi:MAG: amino acid adenylation domain-containing protein, partial [Bacteroidota bacterium]
FEFAPYRIEAEKSVEYLGSTSFQKDKKYWNEQFENIPEPILKRRLNSKKAKAGNCFTVAMTDKQRATIENIASQTKTNIQQLTLAALTLYFGKTEKQKKLVFGVPIHNRRNKKQRLMMGMFAGIIPFKGTFDGTATVEELIQGVRRQQRTDYRYQGYPISYLNRDLKLLSQGRSQLFDIVVNYALLNFTVSADGLDINAHHMTTTLDSTYPLEFWWCDYGNDQPLELKMNYQDAYFTKAELELLVQRILFIISQFPEKFEQPIQDISILPPEERAMMLGEIPAPNGNWFNEGEKDLGNTEPINVRFEKVAVQYPNEIAVVHNGSTWTYQQLNERANQIGHCLKQQGIQQGDFVGVYLERSPVLVSCLLGIMKAGAAYVPLDTQNPIERTERMIANASIPVVITDTTLLSGLNTIAASSVLLIEETTTDFAKKYEAQDITLIDLSCIQQADTTNLPNTNALEDWAYMLYTSGTTGEPKGAITRHNGALNHLLAEYEAMDLPDGFRFLQSAGIGSDISLWQMLAPVLKGGAVVIIDKYDLLDYNKLLSLLTTEKVNLVEFVPSYIWGLVNHLQKMPQSPQLEELLWMMMVGEQVPVQLVNEWRDLFPHVRILNGYGPCEASDDIAQFEILEKLDQEQLRVPIGRPITNMNMFVMDDRGELCPIGVPGELCVSGIGVGAGYYGMPEKTAASFIRNPFPGTLGDVLYKTGDLGRWLPDGNMEFIGRVDRQVKIRGHRVELGEIETSLRQHDGVAEAHLVAHQDLANENHIYLIAFLVHEFANHQAIEAAMKVKCQEAFPVYMRPTHYCFVEEIPHNLSDKVDEPVLLDYFFTHFDANQSDRSFIAPRNQAEEKLAAIWQNVLGLNDIGVYDDFFELGGHSLMAMKVKALIRKTFQVEMEIKDLFNNRTIESLALTIGTKAVEDTVSIIGVQARPERIPLSFSQERLWFIDKLEGSTQYHSAATLHFSGTLDRDALEVAFQGIINRHEVL